jgi:hypothetical protein
MKRQKNCTCGEIEGKKAVLNSFAHIGTTAQLSDNRIYINKARLDVDNNFCPQCGKPYTLSDWG